MGSRSWTVVVATAVALAGVAVGALAVAAFASDGRGTDVPEVDKRPTIVMAGQGVAAGVPDELKLTVAVNITRTDVAPAMDEASRTMRRVLASLTPYGVRRGDTATTGLSVDPQYDYSSRTPRLTGYAVTQRVRVTVRELPEAGRAIAAATAAGGNAVRISGIALDIADRAALLEKARASAVADAQAKARQYTAAGGQQLGAMLSLKEVSTPAPRPQPAYAALDGLVRSAAKAPDVPIRAGKQDLAVRIEVVWELAAAR